MVTQKDSVPDSLDLEIENPIEQLLKEMGLDTCYAQDFAASPLLSEIIALEKSSHFQQERTTNSAENERARVALINELSIKKNMLTRILYKLEADFALKKRYLSRGITELSLQDRQERAAFIRNTSNQDIKQMLVENISDLESVLQSPPKEFTEEDKDLVKTTLKLAIELMQRF